MPRELLVDSTRALDASFSTMWNKHVELLHSDNVDVLVDSNCGSKDSNAKPARYEKESEAKPARYADVSLLLSLCRSQDADEGDEHDSLALLLKFSHIASHNNSLVPS